MIGTQEHRMRRGMGLVEAMIALAISAVLLTAVAAAFRGSADAIDANDQFFRASQGGRVALARIMTHVRRGSVDETSTSTSLHILTDDGRDLTYTYDSSAQQLKVVTNDDLTDADSVLARNVSACQFIIDLGTDYNNAQCVKRVTMQISLNVGSNTVLLTDSASPRRNLVY